MTDPLGRVMNGFIREFSMHGLLWLSIAGLTALASPAAAGLRAVSIENRFSFNDNGPGDLSALGFGSTARATLDAASDFDSGFLTMPNGGRFLGPDPDPRNPPSLIHDCFQCTRVTGSYEFFVLNGFLGSSARETMSYTPIAFAPFAPRVQGLGGYNAFDPRNEITFNLAFGFTPSAGANAAGTRLWLYSYDRTAIIYDSGLVASDMMSFTIPALTAEFGESLGVMVSFDNFVEGTGSQLGLPTTARFSMLTGGIIFAGVPEPTSWAMLIFGFGLTGTVIRKQREARA